MVNIKALIEKYRKGENIIGYLEKNHKQELTREEMISISYDLQAGSYTDYAEENPDLIDSMSAAISNILKNYKFNTMMEVGCGEATTLANVLCHLEKSETYYLGFDISLSRLLHAQNYIFSKNIKNEGQLFLANLFDIPLPNQSVDIVYTAHSIEPNGGKELEAIREVCRVAKDFVFLFEPFFEKASPEGKERMTSHGYIKNLEAKIHESGHKLVEARLFDYCYNKLNPTGLFIIEINKKINPKQDSKFSFRCPKSKRLLKSNSNQLVSEEGGFCYPIINAVPCLLKENGVLLTQSHLIL